MHVDEYTRTRICTYTNMYYCGASAMTMLKWGIARRDKEAPELGPVENQRELIIAAPRWTIAAKLVSVLSLRMATRLNSLSLQKKFSIKCRHL